MNFEELGISVKQVLALNKLNITTPTPVQKKAVPLILKGQNIMAQAKTGTGKTLREDSRCVRFSGRLSHPCQRSTLDRWWGTTGQGAT